MVDGPHATVLLRNLTRDDNKVHALRPFEYPGWYGRSVCMYACMYLWYLWYLWWYALSGLFLLHCVSLVPRPSLASVLLTVSIWHLTASGSHRQSTSGGL